MAIQRFASNNAVLPPEGPLSYPFALDFSKVDNVDVDMSGPIIAEEVSYVSGAYIDNLDNPNPLTILVANINQRVIFPANACGYLPLIITQAAQVNFATPKTDGLIVKVIMVNFPVWPCIIKP